jgi:hypothetical protein
MSKEPQEPILLIDDGAVAVPPAPVRTGSRLYRPRL